MVLSLRVPPRALMAGPNLHGISPFSSPLEEQQYLAEFDAQYHRATLDALSKLKQTTSVVAYQEAFEELTMISTGISQPLLLLYYIIGLRPAIRRELLLKYPSNLMDAFVQARACEARAIHSSSSVSRYEPLVLSSSNQPFIHSIAPSSVPSPDPFPSPKISTPPSLAKSSLPDPPFNPTESPNSPISPSISSPKSIFASPSPDQQSSDPIPLSYPSPDPSIYSPINQFPTIQSLPLDAPQKPIIFPGSLSPIPPSSSDLLLLSKPPPEPPDPDPFVKKEDESGPEPDLNPKRTKELKNAQEGRIQRISRIPPSLILNPNGSTSSTGKRGPANLFKWRYATLDCYENVRRIVKGDWNALVLGETPHPFPSTVEAGRSRRGWVMMAKRKNDTGSWFLESMKMQGIELNVITNTMLLSGWVKVRRIDHANEVFDEMSLKSFVPFATMIYGFTSNCLYSEYLQLFLHIQRSRIHPDSVTFVTVYIKSTGLLVSRTMEFKLRAVMKYMFESNDLGGIALLEAYAKCENVTDSHTVLAKRNISLVSCHELISAIGLNALFEELLFLFKQMRAIGVVLNSISMLIISRSCMDSGPFGLSKNVHAHNVKVEISSQVSMTDTFLEMHLNLGNLETGMCFSSEMADKIVISLIMFIGIYWGVGGAENGMLTSILTLENGMHSLKELRNLVLNLSFNILTRKIPPGLVEIPKLETLDLSWNQLDGDVDWNLLMESSVVHVDLSGNWLTTSSPNQLKFLPDISETLPYLNLSNNRINGLLIDGMSHRSILFLDIQRTYIHPDYWMESKDVMSNVSIYKAPVSVLGEHGDANCQVLVVAIAAYSFFECMMMQVMEYDVVTANMLFSSWVRVKKDDYARRVFDEIPHISIIFLTAMIPGFANNDFHMFISVMADKEYSAATTGGFEADNSQGGRIHGPASLAFILGVKQMTCCGNRRKTRRQFLIHWSGRPPEGATWKSTESLCEQYPPLHLEDKVHLKSGGVDTTPPMMLDMWRKSDHRIGVGVRIVSCFNRFVIEYSYWLLCQPGSMLRSC